MNDEEIEPKAEVSISIKYLNEELDGTEIVDYIHYKKDGSTETISSDVKALEDGSVETKFTTDSFSVYEADITVGVKKVEVEGADGEVEIGTEVTLTANPKGYKEGEKLYYQWQYNPVGYTEKEGKSSEESEKIDESKTNEEDWYDVKGETNKKYTFQLTYENSDYLWRVKVDNKKIKEDNREYEEKTNVGPVGEEKLIKPKKSLRLNLFDLFDQEEKDSEDNEDSNSLTISKSASLSTYSVSRTPSATSEKSEFEAISKRDILHSKTIQYSGNDDYRLHLDFGPIAGEKPIDLLIVIDLSGSMNDSLNGESVTKGNPSKLRMLKRTLLGTETATTNGGGGGWPLIPQTTTYSYKGNGFLYEFMELNASNRVKIVTFSSNGYSDQNATYGWYTNSSLTDKYQQVHDKITNLSANGGTNYEKALNASATGLNDVMADHDTQMIFLTDGLPTYYYDEIGSESGSGSYMNEATLTGTADAIKDFQDNHKSLNISTIGFGVPSQAAGLLNNGRLQQLEYQKITGSEWWEDAIIGWSNKDNGEVVKDVDGLAWNDGEYFSVTSSNTDTALDSLLKSFELSARGPRCTNLSLSDVLSDYVQFNESNPKIQLRAYPRDNNKPEGYLLYTYNGSLNEGALASESEGVEITIPNNDKSGTNKEDTHNVADTIRPSVTLERAEGSQRLNKITLNFNDEWELDPTYRYELSFNIVVTDKAYEEFGETGYPHTGSEGSDYIGNSTSSGNGGFYSNMLNDTGDHAAKLQYDYDGDTYSTEGTGDYKIHLFQRPVVQVRLKETELLKTNEDSTPLASAEFDLYRVDDGTLDIPGSTAKGTKITSLLDVETQNPVAITTPFKSSTEGIIDFKYLTPGTYYLVETKAPEGFNLLEYAIKLEVGVKDIKYCEVKVVKQGDTLQEQNVGNVKTSKLIDGKMRITVANKPGQSLPNTGGAGTKLFTFSGAAVIAASGLMYGYKKKKDKRNRKGGLRK